MADGEKVEPQNKAKKCPQFLAAGIICIGGLGNGSVIAWTSNINADLLNGVLNDIKLTREELSWVGSFMAIGAFVMCFLTGYLAETIGRKFTVLLISVPCIIGWLLLYFAQNIAMLYCGRFLTGMANGAFCITAPIYTTEIAQLEIRGMVGTFYQLFLCIGVFYSNILGKFASLKLDILLCLVVPVVFTISFSFMPETPVYLLKKDKPEKAVKSMAWLRGEDYDATEELEVIQDRITQQSNNKQSMLQMLQTRQAKKATLICFSLMFYMKCSGINAVMFYSQDMLEDTGYHLDPKTSTCVIGALLAVATVFASFTIEKFGRKFLLICSASGSALGTFIIGIYYFLKVRNIVSTDVLHTLGFFPATGLNIYIIAFAIGFGPVPWLASAEIFPPALMAKLSSIAAASNWFWAFVVGKYYVTIADACGADVTFFIFTGISFTAVFFVWFLMPETKNKTFEEIQDELGR